MAEGLQEGSTPSAIVPAAAGRSRHDVPVRARWRRRRRRLWPRVRQVLRSTWTSRRTRPRRVAAPVSAASGPGFPRPCRPERPARRSALQTEPRERFGLMHRLITSVISSRLRAARTPGNTRQRCALEFERFGRGRGIRSGRRRRRASPPGLGDSRHHSSPSSAAARDARPGADCRPGQRSLRAGGGVGHVSPATRTDALPRAEEQRTLERMHRIGGGMG